MRIRRRWRCGLRGVIEDFMKMKKIYLKRAEVMRRLGLSANVYRKWLDAGVLKPRRLGKLKQAVFFVGDIESLENGGVS